MKNSIEANQDDWAKKILKTADYIEGRLDSLEDDGLRAFQWTWERINIELSDLNSSFPTRKSTDEFHKLKAKHNDAFKAWESLKFSDELPPASEKIRAFLSDLRALVDKMEAEKPQSLDQLLDETRKRYPLGGVRGLEKRRSHGI